MKNKLLLLLLYASFPCLLVNGQQTDRNLLTKKLDDYLVSATNTYQFNGSVLIAQKGKILLEKGYGWRNVKDSVRNDSASLFQIGSLTKQFTALLILRLQEQGKLSVLDRLSKYLPHFPQADKISLHHLLTHTSGIPNYTDKLVPYKFILRKTRSKSRLLKLIDKQPLDFEPGTRFKYSNSGYYLLGLVIEKVTGKPYEQIAWEVILRPLQMVHTGFDFRGLRDPNKTTGYSLYSKGRQSVSAVMDSTLLYSAGGLYSTTGDLYRWVKAIANQQLLAPDSWKQAFTPFKNNYAYGWIVDSLYREKYLTHSGSLPNYMSTVTYYSQADITLILLANFSRREDLWALNVELSQLLFNQPYPWGVQPAIRVDESVLKRYVGTYELDEATKLFITLEAGQLCVSGTPSTGISKLGLLSESQTVFYAKPLALELEFAKDARGQIIKLISNKGGSHVEWTRM